MSALIEILAARREKVNHSYNSAKADARLSFKEGDATATEEYIFPNQIEDAFNVVNLFFKEKYRVISVQKKTKVGADGLMIEIAKQMTTHNDDKFVVNPANVRIITGMSNAGWEKDMIEKAPSCFKDKIFHHGKLPRAELTNLSDALIIIDEIDSGDKENQVLHKILRDAHILDVKYLEKNNIRIIVISATMIKELHDLDKWGDHHALYKMTIPSSYIGHKDFLNMGIIQEFYSLETKESAMRWVREDILEHYGPDFRVHLVRVSEKTINFVKQACVNQNIQFRNHTSKERLSKEDIKELFQDPLKQHKVLVLKGLFRRANLIPNSWKVRIGATHEFYTKMVDNNVQIQGLPGRMSGYWRHIIEGGHKTGPHRTSLKSIQEYEKIYNDPFGKHSYRASGFKMVGGKVESDGTLLSHAENLDVADSRETDSDLGKTVPIVFQITEHEYETIKKVGASWDYRTIHDIIKNQNQELADILEEIEKSGGKDQIVEAVGTYATYIEAFVDASVNNKKHMHNGNFTNKDTIKDTFQIYLDKIKYRMIVSIYYGTRTIQRED